MTVRTALLGDVCELNPRLPRAHGLHDDAAVSFVPMAALCEIAGAIRDRQTRRFSEVKKGYTFFAENDVLFAKITPCMENGKAAIARDLEGGLGFGSTEFHVLRAREQVLPEWLYYFVRRHAFRQEARRSLTGTAGQQRVPTAFMAAARIPVPPLDEQRRWVEMLACADSIIRLRRKARRNTELTVSALHVEMFGHPKTNPHGWRVAPLGAVLSAIDSGKSPRCHDRPRTPGEWGVLRLSALRNAAYDESDHKTLPDTLTPDPRHEVRDGDLLFVRKNTMELVGTPAYVWRTQGRMLLPDLIFRLCVHPEAGVDPLYLWALLASPTMRDRMRKMASGTAGSMPNISKERLRTVQAMIPPIGLQQDFARHVRALRAIAVSQDAALCNAEATLAGLLGRFFEMRTTPP